jgi:plastocyanin
VVPALVVVAAADTATRLRRLLAIGLGALVLSMPGLGCGSSSNESKRSGTDVAVADFSFTPKLINVKVGQTVTWTNEGQVAHTVKGPGFFSLRALDHGQKYSHRFSRPGHFNYLCTLHPTLMRGTVVVGG